jgi:hypothetical protein
MPTIRAMRKILIIAIAAGLTLACSYLIADQGGPSDGAEGGTAAALEALLLEKIGTFGDASGEEDEVEFVVSEKLVIDQVIGGNYVRGTIAKIPSVFRLEKFSANRSDQRKVGFTLQLEKVVLVSKGKRSFVLGGKEEEHRLICVVTREELQKELDRRIKNGALHEWPAVGLAYYLKQEKQMIFLEKKDGTKVLIPKSELSDECKSWILVFEIKTFKAKQKLKDLFQRMP